MSTKKANAPTLNIHIINQKKDENAQNIHPKGATMSQSDVVGALFKGVGEEWTEQIRKAKEQEAAKGDPFKQAVNIINKEVEDLRLQTELQADCIRRQDEQIRDLERGVSITWHNGRPDRVIVDSTSVLEYAKKYMKE